MDNEHLQHLYNRRKPSIEERIGKYKNRMELARTSIGVIVLVIQLFILHKLLTQ